MIGMGKFIGLQSGHKNITSNCDPTLATETGAPGEADFNWNVTLHLSEILQKYGFAVQIDDADVNCPDNLGNTSLKDFDFYLAIHAESEPQGGAIVAPDPSVDAATGESNRIVNVIRGAYFSDTGIEENDKIITNNMTFYYMWNVLTAKTPCGIIECGALQDAHDSVILADTRRVALGIAHGICNAFGVAWLGDFTPQPIPPVITTTPPVTNLPALPITPSTQSNQKDSGEVSFMKYLSGKKTYSVTIIMALYAIANWYMHNTTPNEAITTILQAGAIAALRAGINKIQTLA